MRWTFTDCTHQKNLTAEILRISEIDKSGPVYLVKLMDKTYEEPFDVGRIILLAATKVKEVRQELRAVETFRYVYAPSITPLSPSPPHPALDAVPPTVQVT